MRVLITGAGGFLGNLLTTQILKQKYMAYDGEKKSITELILVDKFPMKQNYTSESFSVSSHMLNLSDTTSIEKLWCKDFDIVIHLAAVVSGQAEQEFELGYEVNLDATRNILEALRMQSKKACFFMTSSVAVFGRDLPKEMPDNFPALPLSSYGAQKAIAEILTLDYSRKAFIDGRIMRLPTICVRSGKPNAAASSFVSSIIREPLNDEYTTCPVETDSKLWIMSPDKAIESILYMISLNEEKIDVSRIIHPIGLTVSVQEMLDALTQLEGDEILNYISYVADENVKSIVLSWPSAFVSHKAKELGFPFDQDMKEIISNFKKA